MDFNSIFKVFLPKDRVFYQLFEEVAEHVHQMGIKLKEMVNEAPQIIRNYICILTSSPNPWKFIFSNTYVHVCVFKIEQMIYVISKEWRKSPV